MGVSETKRKARLFRLRPAGRQLEKESESFQQLARSVNWFCELLKELYELLGSDP